MGAAMPLEVPKSQSLANIRRITAYYTNLRNEREPSADKSLNSGEDVSAISDGSDLNCVLSVLRYVPDGIEREWPIANEIPNLKSQFGLTDSLNPGDGSLSARSDAYRFAIDLISALERHSTVDLSRLIEKKTAELFK